MGTFATYRGWLPGTHTAPHSIPVTRTERWCNIETAYKIGPANEAILTAVRALPRAMMTKKAVRLGAVK